MPSKHLTRLSAAMFYTGLTLVALALIGLPIAGMAENTSAIAVVVLVVVLVAGVWIMFNAGRPDTKLVNQRFTQWLVSRGFVVDPAAASEHLAMIERVLTDKDRALPTAQQVGEFASGKVGHRKASATAVKHTFKSNELHGVQVMASPVKVTLTYVAWFVELARPVPDLRVTRDYIVDDSPTADPEGELLETITVEPSGSDIFTDAAREALKAAHLTWSSIVVSGNTMMMYSNGIRIMNTVTRGDSSVAEADLATAMAVAQAIDDATART